jgi:hypothetical protein
MSNARVGRLTATGIGLLLLSPAIVVFVGAAGPLGPWIFIVLLLVYFGALAAVVWGLRSLSGAALLGTVAASPWLIYLGTEAGQLAYLFVLPEFLMLACIGWIGLRRETRVGFKWPGAIAPTIAVVYTGLAPMLRSHFG